MDCVFLLLIYPPRCRYWPDLFDGRKVSRWVFFPVRNHPVSLHLLIPQINVFNVHPCVLSQIPERHFKKFLCKKFISIRWQLRRVVLLATRSFSLDQLIRSWQPSNLLRHCRDGAVLDTWWSDWLSCLLCHHNVVFKILNLGLQLVYCRYQQSYLFVFTNKLRFQIFVVFEALVCWLRPEWWSLFALLFSDVFLDSALDHCLVLLLHFWQFGLKQLLHLEHLLTELHLHLLHVW